MDNKIIQAKAQEINANEMLRLLTDGVLDDLMGLYGDIRIEPSQKAPNDETPLIDVYSDFLAKEQKICSPENAYQDGRQAAQSGREYNDMEYISKVHLSSDNKNLFHERDKVFYNLCNLLGN